MIGVQGMGAGNASILLLIDHMGVGGAQSIVRLLFDSSQRSGWEVRIVTNDPRGEQRAYIILGHGHRRYQRVMRALFSLSRLWNLKPAEIVHLHSPCLSMVMAAMVLKLRGWKLVYTVHANRKHIPAWAWRVEKILFRIADVICLELNASRADFAQDGINPRKTAWIPFGVPEASMEVSWKPRERQPFCFVALSRLDPDRRVQTILDAYLKAFPECGPEVSLLFVGDGSIRDQLVAAVLAARRTDIRFQAPVQECEIQHVLATSDCLVTLTAQGEVGMTGKIAAGVGIPMIAVEMEESHVAWTARDPDQLAELMRKVASMPPAGLEAWRDEFSKPLRCSSDEMVSSYSNLYEELHNR